MRLSKTGTPRWWSTCSLRSQPREDQSSGCETRKVQSRQPGARAANARWRRMHRRVGWPLLLLGHCCPSRLGAQPAGADGRAGAELTQRLMTLHAQLTEAWYSAIGALLAAEAEAQALAE
mmetsp:Transcript_16250/g.37540  ORF Transcript_16250/g.37540 Transcript_16250/m.37540 type:complete len:120 (+) Transcript_16250:21-380(+)